MIRRNLPLFALTLTISIPALAVATKPGRPQAAPLFEPPTAFEQRADPQELLREAKDLWLIQEDFTGALAKFNEAVEADPDDLDTRLQRAHYFEVLSLIVVPSDRPKFEARARADFERIIDADPESMIAGVARDGLTRISGEPLISSKLVACPEPAVNLHGRANALYGAHQYAEAVAEYTRATSGCPENSGWWVELADSFYEMEDFERAKAHFAKAIAVDRWNREAHRYLADTYVQLGDNDAAMRELVSAVVSDPTYEAGWSALRAYGMALGRKFMRVYGDRRTVPENAEAKAWGTYAAAKEHARLTLGESASALAVERDAVKAVLKSGGSGPFWSMLARAERGGYLDEAIFLHLLDADLAAEYPAYRETNATRLASYLATMILR